MRNQSLYNTLREYNKQEDYVTLDIPLLIRLFEYAREDVKDDLELHIIAKNMITMCKEKGQLSVYDYKQIIDKK